MKFLSTANPLLAILVAYAANPPRHVAQSEMIYAPQPAIAGEAPAVQIDGSDAVMLAGHSASSSTNRADGAFWRRRQRIAAHADARVGRSYRGGAAGGRLGQVS